MKKELIKKINDEYRKIYLDNEQGIFLHPFGVPDHIKEYVIYCRWITGGSTGAGYHDYNYSRPVENDGEPTFTVLNLVLKELKPDITVEQSTQIEQLIYNNEKDDDWDYYGNYYEYGIKYIILKELEEFLEVGL